MFSGIIILPRASFKYCKGVHYQFLCFVSTIFKLAGKSIVKTKLLGKKVSTCRNLSRIWSLICSFKVCHLFAQSHLNASFLSFVIQLCLQYWTKNNLVRKKIVHLISKINLPQQKDNKLKKRVTKWGIELDKKSLILLY